MLMGVLLLILSAAAAGEILHWLVLAYRGAREMREAPFVANALRGPQPTEWPMVSIVVPAHNEQRVVEACARSILTSDYASFELIFVLDRCTDRTRALLEPIAAADPRVRIIDNATCPDDWAGKCNAARVGAASAKGALLLFTDADTWFDPRLVRASVSLLRSRSWQMLSLLSAPTHHHWFERVVQPVASLMLLKLFPLRRANAPVNRRAFANGQFMLFDRASYEALGGHAAVKDDLLEDIGFARRMNRAGMTQGVGVSAGLLVVSMYDSWTAFRNGWRRIYIESCNRNPARLRGQAFQILGANAILPALRIAAMALAVVALCQDWPDAWLGAKIALWLGAIAWIGRLVVLATLYSFCQFPVWAIFLNGVASVAVAKIFLQGARDLEARTPVRWGGRQYVLEPTNL